MLHPRGRDKTIYVLEAYFDESGITREDAHCIVAGFVGSASQWQLFEEQWERASGGVVFDGMDFLLEIKPVKGSKHIKAGLMSRPAII